jgi:hypothetical protein
MSLVRGLDDNGDWLFGKSLNDYRTFKNAVEQNIATRLRSFLGDCFFSQEAGIDWFNLLGSRNALGLELAASAVLLNTESVLNINSVDVITDINRNLVLRYSVNTTYGLITNELVDPIEAAGLLLSELGETLTDEFGNPLALDEGNATNNTLVDEFGNLLTDEFGNPLGIDP